MKRGCGGSIAWLITVRQAKARATTESRFRPIAPATQYHLTASKACQTVPQSGPRHQSSATTPAAPASDGHDPEQRRAGDAQVHASSR